MIGLLDREFFVNLNVGLSYCNKADTQSLLNYSVTFSNINDKQGAALSCIKAGHYGKPPRVHESLPRASKHGCPDGVAMSCSMEFNTL